jgi:hypothetical protein
MTDPEEEFLRRVADPALIEARARRRTRHRAEEAGLTDEQLRDRDDETFRNSANWLIAGEADRRKSEKIDELAQAHEQATEKAVELAQAYEAQAKKVPSFKNATAEKARATDRNAAWAGERITEGWSKADIAAKAKRGEGVTIRTVERWLHVSLGNDTSVEVSVR